MERREWADRRDRLGAPFAPGPGGYPVKGKGRTCRYALSHDAGARLLQTRYQLFRPRVEGYARQGSA